MTHNEAKLTLATARNPANGKPLENNTRLFQRGEDYAVRLHDTDVVTIHPNNEYTLNTGGWFTVTTKGRIASYSPARIYSDKGEWFLRWYDDEPEPQIPYRDIPAYFDALDPGPRPTKRAHACIAGRKVPYPDDYGDAFAGQMRTLNERDCDICTGDRNAGYLWESSNHPWKRHQRYMEQFGSEENWRSERKAHIRERREAWKQWHEWDDRHRVEFFDGIRIDSDGRVVNPLAPKAVEESRSERSELRTRINAYVDNFMIELATNGLPFPSGGDCWYCALRDSDGKTMGDHGSNDHLLSHIEENYYVPSLAWNAVEEAGYRSPGVILWCDPDTQRMGGSHMVNHAVRPSLERYLKRRLISGGEQRARMHAVTDRI